MSLLQFAMSLWPGIEPITNIPFTLPVAARANGQSLSARLLPPTATHYAMTGTIMELFPRVCMRCVRLRWNSNLNRVLATSLSDA